MTYPSHGDGDARRVPAPDASWEPEPDLPAGWADTPVAPETLAGPVPPAPFRAPAADPAPDLGGVTFDRSTEHNSRAVIGAALSGLGLGGVLVWFLGLSTPLLAVVALGIGGIVMGVRGWASARNGLATNGGLGVAAVVMGLLAVLGVVAVYALVLAAIGRMLG